MSERASFVVRRWVKSGSHSFLFISNVNACMQSSLMLLPSKWSENKDTTVMWTNSNPLNSLRWRRRPKSFIKGGRCWCTSSTISLAQSFEFSFPKVKQNKWPWTNKNLDINEVISKTFRVPSCFKKFDTVARRLKRAMFLSYTFLKLSTPVLNGLWKEEFNMSQQWSSVSKWATLTIE